jgi:histidine kinase
VIKTAGSFFLKKVQEGAQPEPAVMTTLLEKIDGNVDRATRIINHMRQFARKADPALVKLQINVVLHKAFEMFSQQLHVRGIAVHWELAAELPEIFGDPGRLEQVFINLLLNARDAIEARWSSAAIPGGAKRITLQSALEGKTVAVRVSDTGTGIPPGIADKIFEPFFTTKEVGQGTGLGLSISYGIIQECGGTITAANNVDGGATFTLRFPAPEAA